MHVHCPHCGVALEPEPGFYFGAMFVSYAINVAIFVTVWISLRIIFRPADWAYLVALPASAIFFLPWTYRYSRILFLYWFGGLRSRQS
jgi:hypothetical protein